MKEKHLEDKYLVLKRKYVNNIYRNNDSITLVFNRSAIIDEHFVLRPDRDPAALRSLVVYSQFCHNPLAKNIVKWIKEIGSRIKSTSDTGSLNKNVIETVDGNVSNNGFKWISCESCGSQVPGVVSSKQCYYCESCGHSSGSCKL